MTYKVICYFEDLQDFNHPYNVGDIFPRQGMNVSESRIRELASVNNKRGKVLIVADETKKVVAERKKDGYTKTEINRMSVGDLRELAKKNGIEEVQKLSGSVLKRMLIEKLVWEL